MKNQLITTEEIERNRENTVKPLSIVSERTIKITY
jgi:hypothetical protein